MGRRAIKSKQEKIIKYYIADVDECTSANACSVHAICINTIGSHTCTCKLGYQGNGTICEGTAKKKKEDKKEKGKGRRKKREKKKKL